MQFEMQYRPSFLPQQHHSRCSRSNRSSIRRGVLDKVLLGCGLSIFASLLICAGAAFWLFPMMIQKMGQLGNELKEFAQKEAEREQLFADWHPPDAKAEDLFPLTVGEFTRMTKPAQAPLTELGIVKPFWHAEYASPSHHLDVSLKAVSEQEREANYQSVLESLNHGLFQFRYVQGGAKGKRIYFQISPPQQTGWLWWNHGWQLIVIADSDDDPEMLVREFFKEIEGRPETVDEPAENTSPEKQPAAIETKDEAVAEPSSVEPSPQPTPARQLMD